MVTAQDRLRQIDDAVFALERNGILVDVEFCDRTALLAEEGVLTAWQRIAAVVGNEKAELVAGLPPQMLPHGEVKGESPKSLGEFVHDELGVAPSPYWSKGKVKLDKGEKKLDAVALGWLARNNQEHAEFFTALLALRRERGCLKYLRKLPRFVNPTTGRVHPCYGAASDGDDRFGAVTGRLACKFPELQQITNDPVKDKYRIRKAFVAAPGNVVLEADLTALEVALMGDLTYRLFGDRDLFDAASPGAPDIHGVNAIRVFKDFLKMPDLDGLTPDMIKKLKHPLRQRIKNVFYKLQYGGSGYSFGNTIFDDNGIAIGEEMGTALQTGILAARPGIQLFQEWVREYIVEHRGIPSLLGRWCDLSDLIPGKDWQVNRAWRRALNYPLQSSGSDIMGIAMHLVVTDETLYRLGFKLTLQVHDALLLEGPEQHAAEARARVLDIMTNAANYPFLKIQLQADAAYGVSWENGH